MNSYTNVRDLKWVSETEIQCTVYFHHLNADAVITVNGTDEILPHVKDIFDRAVAGEFGDIESYVPPVVPYKYSKVYFFSALTDEEYSTFEYIQSQQPPREQAIFQNATELSSTNPLTQKFEYLVLQAYGEQRGTELLNASKV